jgi:hypothetical protein
MFFDVDLFYGFDGLLFLELVTRTNPQIKLNTKFTTKYILMIINLLKVKIKPVMIFLILFPKNIFYHKILNGFHIFFGI